MIDNTFTCALCGNVYDKAWSDAESIAEKDALFGPVPLEDCAIICDDCFELVAPANNPVEYAAWQAGRRAADEEDQ